jgi:DNA-binding transcriptional regulator YdaS (Cro superfamily)
MAFIWGNEMLRSNARPLDDDDDVLKLLHSRVKSAGGQSAFAKQSGVSREHLNRVLNGRMRFGSAILGVLNLRMAYTTSKKRGRADAHVLDHDDVLKLLHSRVKSAGSQAAFSRQGVERTHLNLVLSGRRPLSPSIIDALNLRIVYLPVQ